LCIAVANKCLRGVTRHDRQEPGTPADFAACRLSYRMYAWMRMR